MKNQKTIMLCLAFGILGIALHSADSVNGSEKNNQLKNALLDFQNHNNINISECDANGDGIVNVIDLCRMKAEIINNQELIFVSGTNNITTDLTVPAESAFLTTTQIITTTPIISSVTPSQTYTSVSTSKSGTITTKARIYTKAQVNLYIGTQNGQNQTQVIAEFDTWDEAWKYAEQYQKEHPDAMLTVSQSSSPAVTAAPKPVTTAKKIYGKAQVNLYDGTSNGYNETHVIAEFDTWNEAWEYAEQYKKEHPDAMLTVSQGATS